MKKFEQIQTREHLEHRIRMLIYKHFNVRQGEVMFGQEGFIIELCDLIADLPNLCFHEKKPDLGFELP